MWYGSPKGSGMKSLGRAIFKAASALSLVLCVTVAVPWVRSHWVYDRLWLSPRRGVQYWAVSTSGSIVVSRSVLTGRTADVFSDASDRGSGWSVDSRRAVGPSVSPFTPEGSPP